MSPMAHNWSLTPPIRERILKRKPFKGVWSRTLTIMVILNAVAMKRKKSITTSTQSNAITTTKTMQES